MANILVTGGAGYVGSHCVRAVSAAGHTIVVFDNLFRGHRDLVRAGKLVEGDVRDAKAVDAIFKTYRFDAVMHFAALAYVGESVTDPSSYYDVNVHGTRVLLDAMRRNNVNTLVFSSTCALYGEPAQIPIREGAELSPINPYGFSKLVCERMMDDFERTYGLKSARLRYFNAAGAEPGGEIGEDHTPETHLIPLVLDVALGRRQQIEIYGTDYPTPDGTAIRDYVHVCDLARAHLLALDHVLTHLKTIAVNLGRGQGVSVREIVETARKVTGCPIRVAHSARRAGDPAQLVADPRKAQEILGWSAERSDPETIIADAWRWHRVRFGQRVRA